METRKERKERCVKFIIDNLNLSNEDISKILKIKVRSITSYMEKNNIKRTKEQLFKIRSDTGKYVANILHTNYRCDGYNNPNWKGGISKNNYHYKKIQIERYPDRVKARRKVHYAIKNGKLKRGCCEECGESKTFAHHEDYSKPLEVNWLCIKHHREKHDNKH